MTPPVGEVETARAILERWKQAGEPAAETDPFDAFKTDLRDAGEEATTLPEPATPEQMYLAAIAERLGVLIELNQALVTAFAAGIEEKPEPDGRKAIKLMDGSFGYI